MTPSDRAEYNRLDLKIWGTMPNRRFTARQWRKLWADQMMDIKKKYPDPWSTTDS